MHYAYLHGFASSSLSLKGQELSDIYGERGVNLFLPDLNEPSFSMLTYTGALGVIDELDAEVASDGEPWRFIASSMGGYLAARWAELHPGRVDRLVLLCPGFDLSSRWPKIMGESHFESWKEEGEFLFFDASGKLQPVHWGFIEDADSHPAWPEVPCPTLILHGTDDEIVPIEHSRTYAADHDHVELIELDDAHDLRASVERIAEESLRFFQVDS